MLCMPRNLHMEVHKVLCLPLPLPLLVLLLPPPPPLLPPTRFSLGEMTWEGKKVEKTIGFAFVPLDWITGPLLAPPLLLLLLLLLLPLLLLRRLLLLPPPPRPLRPIWFSAGERIWESKNVETTIGFDWFTTNCATACSTTLVRGVSAELDDENWRLCSATLVRGAICGAGR